jgi:hypothetical protein
MNKARKLTKRNGCRCYTRPSEPLINEWLRPVVRRRVWRSPRDLAWNKWEHGKRRFQEAHWIREARKQAEHLLELGNVTVKASYIYDFPYDGYGEIVQREPAGRRWLDYVPLQGSREYRVARGDDYPANDTAYFVPEFPFSERLDYHCRIGMPRHDAWEAARLAVLDAAHKHLSSDTQEIHVVIVVDGEEYYNCCSWSDEPIDPDDKLEALELVASVEGLDWIIRSVEAERAELTAGQVGPV